MFKTMSKKISKFLEFEDRIFRAPYNYLKKIGLIDKVKRDKTTFCRNLFKRRRNSIRWKSDVFW